MSDIYQVFYKERIHLYMNMKQHSLTIVFLLIVLSLSTIGCERIDPVIPSDTTKPMLKIGIIQPSHSYTTFSQGAETARVQINDNGGVLGMPVEFISRNNQPLADMPPTAQASIDAANELIDMESVFALLGPVRSSMAIEVGPIAQEAQRLMLPGSSGSNVPEVGDYVFLITVPNPFQGKVMASFAMNPDELGANTAATIYEEGDAYSTDLVQAFEAAFKELNGEIVHSGSYAPGEMSFTTLLSEIQNTTPDVIFCPGHQPEVPLLINEVRKRGINTTFLGGSAWDDRERFLGVLEDSTVLDGSYYPTNFSVATQDTDVQEFVHGYMELYDSPPDGIAASGYDAMRLLARAIETAGSLDPAAVRKAFAEVKDYKGATSISYYDANRHPVKSLAIQTIRNGKVEHYKVVEP
ncbi:ABC transporter substrate-binding protein [Candidatus Poribacteria bacterium]|nr:ABC transporter substrate-binding protein [Candidatus Poribacteria bacterium]